MFPFYTPWKQKAVSSFLIFSGGIEKTLASTRLKKFNVKEKGSVGLWKYTVKEKDG